MAFMTPEVHRVQEVYAHAHGFGEGSDYSGSYLRIEFRQEGEQLAMVDVYGAAGMLFKFRRLAEAVNKIFGKEQTDENRT